MPINAFYLLGFILFCAGALLGIPHGLSKRRGNLHNTELWRVAHLSTCIGGLSIIGITVALEHLLHKAGTLSVAVFIASAYCFFLACTISGFWNAAWDGDRSTLRVRAVYYLQIIASTLSVLAISLAAFELIF